MGRVLLILTCALMACSTGGLPTGVTPDLGGAADLAAQDGPITLPVDLATAPTPLIPKSGPAYTGPHLDPMLSSGACPDVDIEPNDDPANARMLMAAQDQPSPKIIKLAICPPGAHDVDYYRVTAKAGTLMAELFYDITYGDLDIAVFDAAGKLLVSDGTAVTNGCAAASVGNDDYYVVVAGANNQDANRYELRVRTFSTPKTCP